MTAPAAASAERHIMDTMLDCATSARRLLRVQDPFAKLFAECHNSSVCTISAAALWQVTGGKSEGGEFGRSR